MSRRRWASAPACFLLLCHHRRHHYLLSSAGRVVQWHAAPGCIQGPASVALACVCGWSRGLGLRSNSPARCSAAVGRNGLFMVKSFMDLAANFDSLCWRLWGGLATPSVCWGSGRFPPLPATWMRAGRSSRSPPRAPKTSRCCCWSFGASGIFDYHSGLGSFRAVAPRGSD